MNRVERESLIKLAVCVLLYLAACAVGFMPGPIHYSQPETLIFCALIIVWGTTIMKRIPDRFVRRNLLAMSVFMAFFIILRSLKYRLLSDGDPAQAYVFYLYAPVTILISQHSFLAAISVGRTNYRSMAMWNRIHIAGAAIGILVLTNNLHHLVYVPGPAFPGNINDYVYGPLFWVYIVYREILMAASVIIAIRKCRVSVLKRFMWIPILIVVAGYSLIIWDALPSDIFGRAPFRYPEVFCGLAAFMWESLIQIGLVRSCESYEEIFDISSIAMSIIDDDRETMRESRVSAGLKVTEDLAQHRRKIRGGEICWFDDISEVRNLRRELDAGIARLREEEVVIRTQKELERERERLSYKQNIYDTISDAVSPRLELMRRSLARNDFRESVIYGVYIKRRANLMLLEESGGEVALGELVASIRDCLEYVKLTVPSASLVFEGGVDQEKKAEASRLISCFDSFEAFLENHIIGVSCPADGLILRIGPASDASGESGLLGTSDVVTMTGEISRGEDTVRYDIC